VGEGIEHIGKKSVLWSYCSVFFSVGAGVILLPFILHKMPSETVAIWNIFQAIYSLTVLMDFGFRPSFSRNVSYILSGVRTLQVEGVASLENEEVDYNLLKKTLQAMKLFYRWLSIFVLILLLTGGTFYFFSLMSKYSGDKEDAIVAWFLLCFINCFNLYTLYYDSLLTGKGYVKQLQQITILGQSIYLGVAVALIYCGFGLSAIVLAQISSIVVKRILAYRTFFQPEMKERLSNAIATNSKDVLLIILPNAIKVGLTQLGGYVVTKSSLFIGSIYIALDQMAYYGVSVQVIDILARCGTILYVTFSPRIAGCRVHRDIQQIKKLYVYCVLSLFVIYLAGGSFILLFGNTVLDIIGSQTHFMSFGLLFMLIVISLLEQNHIIAAGFIQSDNKIPFFVPSIISGLATVAVVWVFLDYFSFGLYALVLAPGLVQLVYQNWKWPSVIINDFRQNGKQNIRSNSNL